MALTFSEEFKTYDIASNALWPKTAIATSAILNMAAGKLLEARSRQPEIMADACFEIITRDAKHCTGGTSLSMRRCLGIKASLILPITPVTPAAACNVIYF